MAPPSAEYDNNTWIIKEKDGALSVKVKEISLNANGGYSVIDMSADQFIIGTGTKVSCFSYDKDGQLLDDKNYSRGWSWGSNCGTLKEYATRELEGEVEICNGVTLYGSNYIVRENDIYGLEKNFNNDFFTDKSTYN